MPHVIHTNTLKANPFSLFALFVISGLAILTLVFSMIDTDFWGESLVPARVAFVVVETGKPLFSDLPKVLMIPIVQVDASGKDVRQKVAIVAPQAFENIVEAHLKIPRLGVDAVIKEMGYASGGAMAVPNNRIDVGWFNLGTRPGETGSAVIGAHYRWDSKAGVFAHLDQLQKGDVLSVVDAKGTSILFVVRDMRTYDATDTHTGIFKSESGAHLNLITCSGAWDPSAKTYTKRLVIFTDVVDQTAKEITMAPIRTF